MSIKETIDENGGKHYSLYYPMTIEMMLEMTEIGDFNENIKDIKELVHEDIDNDIDEVLHKVLPYMFPEK